MELESLAEKKSRLEHLKATKGQLSRKIGEARKVDTNVDALIAELKDVSAGIKGLQKEIKQRLNELAEDEKWLPAPVVPPSSVLNRTLSGPIAIEPWSAELLADTDAYCEDHPGASIWHTPAISNFIESSFKHKSHYLCALTSDRTIVGVLPIIQLNSRLFGNFLVSMPYFNYGGLLADNAEVAHQLVEAAGAWLQQRDARHLELRFGEDINLGLPQRTDKVSFWLPLPEKPDDLWASFKPKLRAQIRRGERELSGFDIGGLELLDEFYRVFSVNMRDLGTPVYGKRFFQGLLEVLGDRARLVVARINGQAVGCAFLVGYQGRMEIPWASTLRKFSHTGVNMIMYWMVLKFAIRQGYEVFDFGRCSKDAGTYRFKQQWGAQPINLHWDYILPEGESLPQLNPDNPKFRLLIAAWQRLPVFVANLLGPHIVKDLP